MHVCGNLTSDRRLHRNVDKPNEFGEAILTTTAMKMIGRQKGNLNVLRDFVHLNETTINYIKNLPMTEKGKKSEFLGIIGEKAETTILFRSDYNAT